MPLIMTRYRWLAAAAVLGTAITLGGCTVGPLPRQGRKVTMEVTAYCPCGECNGYTCGSWVFLKLDRWNCWEKGSGRRYTGKTASGTYPRKASPGLFSPDTIANPSRIPERLLPWNILPRTGTLAADTDFYPFGTRMYVPGYGWGRVEDRGGAIKGPNKLDVFVSNHRQTRSWGRRQLEVTITGP
jgi:hypothetical protein